MPYVGADVLAEWRVVPENVVPLSVFAFGSRVVEGVLISAFVKCFLVWWGRLCRMKLCPMKGMKVVWWCLHAGMSRFFVVIGRRLLSRCTYRVRLCIGLVGAAV